MRQGSRRLEQFEDITHQCEPTGDGQHGPLKINMGFAKNWIKSCFLGENVCFHMKELRTALICFLVCVFLSFFLTFFLSFLLTFFVSLFICWFLCFFVGLFVSLFLCLFLCFFVCFFVLFCFFHSRDSLVNSFFPKALRKGPSKER